MRSSLQVLLLSRGRSGCAISSGGEWRSALRASLFASLLRWLLAAGLIEQRQTIPGQFEEIQRRQGTGGGLLFVHRLFCRLPWLGSINISQEARLECISDLSHWQTEQFRDALNRDPASLQGEDGAMGYAEQRATPAFLQRSDT